jgi:hypothetical protein
MRLVLTQPLRLSGSIIYSLTARHVRSVAVTVFGRGMLGLAVSARPLVEPEGPLALRERRQRGREPHRSDATQHPITATLDAAIKLARFGITAYWQFQRRP